MKVQLIKFFHAVKTPAGESSFIDSRDQACKSLSVDVDVEKNLVSILHKPSGSYVYANFNNVIYFTEERILIE